MQGVRQINLTTEELNQLVFDYKETGNPDSAEKLFCACFGIISRKASVYPFNMRDEMLLAGYSGMIKAVKTFDPEKGSFNTHIDMPVRKAMDYYVRKNQAVYIPQKNKRSDFSFVRLQAENDDGLTLENVIGVDDPEKGLSEEAFLAKEALKVLDEMELLVINERYLNDNHKTLQAIADEVGKSKERIRQIESKALAKIKEEIEWTRKF